jgi:hypothetical protein
MKMNKNVRKITSGIATLPYYLKHYHSHLTKIKICQINTRGDHRIISKGRIWAFNRNSCRPSEQKIMAGSLIASKTLRSLDIQTQLDNDLLRGIKHLHNLQNLRIGLDYSQIAEHYKMFKDLTFLKIVILKVSEGCHLSQIKNLSFYYKFFENLLSLDSLQNVKIDLSSDCQKNILLVETVLHYLERSKVLSFEIKANLQKREDFDVNKIKGVLAQIDCLSILPSEFEMKSYFSFLKLWGKKALIFQEPHVSIDIASIIKECTSLNALDLSYQIPINLPQDFICPQNLTRFVINCPVLNTNRNNHRDWIQNLINLLNHVVRVEFLYLTFSSLPEEDLINFRALHSLLRSKDMTSYIVKLGLDGDIPDLTFETLCEEIGTFEYMEHLTMDFFLNGDMPNLRYLENMLKKIQGLKSLNINLRYIIEPWEPEKSAEEKKISFYIPFDNLSNLTFFDLGLPEPLQNDCTRHLYSNLKLLVLRGDMIIGENIQQRFREARSYKY